MERLHYVEIELKRATVALRVAEKRKKDNWLVNPLKSYIAQLQAEKTYYYLRMMTSKTY